MTLRTMPLIALAIACFALPASAQKIATANAGKIFKDIQETKDITAKMDSERKSIEAQDQERKQKVKDLQGARFDIVQCTSFTDIAKDGLARKLAAVAVKTDF